MIRTLTPVLLLALLACNQPSADPAELTAEQWQQDLAYLANKLPAKHGNAFHQTSQADFEAAVAQLNERIPSLAHHQVLAEMGRIVALVGDGHTELWLPQETTRFRHLPIAVHDFGKDLHVFATTPDHAQLLGVRVVALGAGLSDVPRDPARAGNHAVDRRDDADHREPRRRVKRNAATTRRPYAGMGRGLGSSRIRSPALTN